VVVLLTGASGFIGQHLAPALRSAGHRVIAAVHRRGGDGDTVMVDFARDFDPAVWRPRLEGVDAVINAVGILRERGEATFDALHVRAPRALFAAAAEVGVHRVVQISALGADEEATSRYHTSKRRADEFLLSLPLSSVIVQPSLVYGRGGASAELFDTLASLPLIPLPAGGRQRIQPLHIDDLVTAIVALLDVDSWRVGRLPLVGPAPTTVREYLATLQSAMGLPPARVVPIPPRLVDIVARIADSVPTAPFDRETFAMLERGNTASPLAMRTILGREPRAPWQFVHSGERGPVAARAQLNWLLPLLWLAIAVMWIATGIISLAVYPLGESYALLARVGIGGKLAAPVLGAAAALNLVLGILTLTARNRWLWRLQIAVVIFYTLVISWYLPEYWAHPYGPVLKNVPILVLLIMLLRFEER
jgi:uncharacterized protein YbjT (DUF2867 family)